jgi:glycosyltransferase involved in cell wall biosynthesis
LKRRRIIYVQYTNPAAYPPLEHSSQILAENDWDVLFLGTGALGADKLRFDEQRHIRVRRMRFQSPGARQKLHYALFNVWCLIWFLRWRPDCVYFSELHACPLGLLAALAGMRTIFHEHDIPQSNPTGRFARLVSWSRQQFARRATLCVVPNAKRGEHLVRAAGTTRMLAVVSNCPRAAEVAPKRAGLPEGSLRVLYHGSIVPDRLPLSVIGALAKLPNGVTLTVVGYETVGAEGHIESLRARATELGIGERLNIAGTLATRSELISMCGRHDVGLALMPLGNGDLNMESMAGASNKPYDYLACGLALIVSNSADWEQMFVKPGFGLSCDPSSAESVAGVLNTFATQPVATRTMGERGRQRVIDEWNYERQFRPVLDLLSRSGRNASDSVAQTQAGWKEKAIR